MYSTHENPLNTMAGGRDISDSPKQLACRMLTHSTPALGPGGHILVAQAPGRSRQATRSTPRQHRWYTRHRNRQTSFGDACVSPKGLLWAHVMTTGLKLWTGRVLMPVGSAVPASLREEEVKGSGVSPVRIST